MINHARTLILNMVALPSGTTPDIGESYIEPSFSMVQYTGKLKSIQETLVAPSGSRSIRNFQVYSMLCLIHAPDYSQYVTTFDPRLTYTVDYSPYISQDLPRANYPSFNLSTLYVSLSSAIYAGGTSLFDMCPDQAEDMTVFKDIWHGNLAVKDRVTASILAAYYAMEYYRQHAI